MKLKELKIEHKLKFISLILSVILMAVFLLPDHDDPIGYAGPLLFFCCLLAVVIYTFSMVIYLSYKQTKQKSKSRQNKFRQNQFIQNTSSLFVLNLFLFPINRISYRICNLRYK